MRPLQSEQFRSLSLVFILILAPLTSFIQQDSSLQEKSPFSHVNASLDVNWDWWEIEHSTNDIAGGISNVVDENDNTHIVYLDNVNTAIKYATDSSGVWVNETIASASIFGSPVSFSEHNSIAIDSNGFVHISFMEQDTMDRLVYMNNLNGTWNWTDLSCVCGGYSSIAVDSNDDIHIAHSDISSDVVKYSYFDGTSWSTVNIDSSDSNGPISLTLDQNDEFHLLYRKINPGG